jgi:hypothetical protein
MLGRKKGLMKESRRGGGAENRKDCSRSLSICSCLRLRFSRQKASHCVYAIVSCDIETEHKLHGFARNSGRRSGKRSAVGGPADSAETMIPATEHLNIM